MSHSEKLLQPIKFLSKHSRLNYYNDANAICLMITLQFNILCKLFSISFIFHLINSRSFFTLFFSVFHSFRLSVFEQLFEILNFHKQIV